MERNFFKLLFQYNLLPHSERHISIFEVSGYPHYENVCSNVLAFYLNPQKEHGLGCLVLAALLQIAGHDLERKVCTIEVHREFPTISGGRLDLFIISDAYVIGIENKIFHHLHNDLLDYKNTIDRSAGNQLIPVRIVLSLKPIQTLKEHGFVSITYRDLWREVRTNFGFNVTSATQKWITYLIDFMETTELLSGKGIDLTDRDKFFIENEEIIERLIKDRKEFIARLNIQVTIVKDLIENSEDSTIQCDKRWIYDSDCLVHDYILSGNKVAFDLYVSPSGWILKLFGRNRLSHNYVAQLVATRRDQIIVTDGRFIIAKWPLTTDLGEIKEKLCEWMNWIVQEDANKSFINIGSDPTVAG